MAEKKTLDELAALLKAASAQITVGAEYRHFKGTTYKVLQLAIMEATNEPCVVYQANYGEGLIFVRPTASWLAMVSTDDGLVPRFTRLES